MVDANNNSVIFSDAKKADLMASPGSINYQGDASQANAVTDVSQHQQHITSLATHETSKQVG